MAKSLEGRAGFWTWRTLQRDFPMDAYLDKLNQYGHNFTAMAHFTEHRGLGWRARSLADLIHRRVRRLNRAGDILPIIYIFNRWQFPWEKDYLPEFDAGWVTMLSEATAGLDLMWCPCLEPLPESRDLVTETLAHLAIIGDKRPTVHNGHFYVHGADYYETGVPGNPAPADFWNGDHHPEWLRQFNPAVQVAYIQQTPARVGCLMVTEMTLDGKVQALPGWPTRVANWDHPESWAEMGKRTQQEPVEPPEDPYPYLELARLIRRRDVAINLGEGDAKVNRRTRRVEDERKRLLGEQ